MLATFGMTGAMLASSVFDGRRWSGADAGELYRESGAFFWIDEFFHEITRVTDDYSRLDPSRLQESVLCAYLTGKHDAWYVRVKFSLPHDLARRNIFVAVNEGRDIVAPA